MRGSEKKEHVGGASCSGTCRIGPLLQFIRGRGIFSRQAGLGSLQFCCDLVDSRSRPLERVLLLGTIEPQITIKPLNRIIEQ